MTDDWEDRVLRFWADVDLDDADAAVAAMRTIVEDRPAGDADALYEWGSVHDSVGREAEAIPAYRAALDAGLSGARRPQAVVQLASSLRNVGEAATAVELLESLPPHPAVGDAPAAFLALALHDLGRHEEALRVALQALAPTLPRYSRAVRAYAAELERRASLSGGGCP